ncbi:amidohydrolase family protein [Candidatus Poriferisocius sp.]|uniref:amidohydrolase family protein n=1 Tax=Candidatus Poriferisocius sp. TaxID=3101276 RepID=UPI003B013E55
MSSRRLGFPVFDADNHMYETTEALTKHLPDSHRGLIDYIDHNGRTKILVRGRISNYIPNPTFRRVGSPGAQEEYFKHGNPEGKSRREIMKPMDALPAFFEPEPRLELMNELGLDYAMMYPTLASLVEERFRDAPDECHIVIHALNRWMHEHWTFNYRNRIFPVPIVTLPIMEKAIEELEWCVERGARAVLIRPAPPPGLRGPRSFALPEFDPFWERVVELDVLVAMHASDSGYTRFTNEWEGSSEEMMAFNQSLFQMSVMHNRAIEDAVTSWVAHGALTRHPRLKVAIIENGSSWVRPLLAHLETCYRRMPHAWEEHPVDVIRRNIWIHPFHEDDPIGLIGVVGADNVVFGSDYPHVEGMADPISFVDQLDGLPEDQIQKVMGGNMSRLMKVA